jgi:rhodanese-related sulfurtransferase
MKMKTLGFPIALCMLVGCMASPGPSPSPAMPAPGGTISPERARAMLADARVVLLDVRTLTEFESGHIKGAALLPYSDIDASSAAAAIPAKDAKIIVYCRSGRRSAIAQKALIGLGYGNVWDLGGVDSWPYGLEK